MKIGVRVVLRSSTSKVEKLSDSQYRAHVHARPHRGKANEELLLVLARYFKISKRNIRIVSGLSSRTKLVEINPHTQPVL